MRNLVKNREWFARAKRVIPGCAQTFSKGYTQYVQGVAPIFLERGKGSIVWDVDGHTYIDYVQGLLPNILGYAEERVNKAAWSQLENGHSFSLPHPVEVELAEKLCQIIPCSEMVRFGKNGSDATSGAIRAARAWTCRDIIACCGYHGWQDWYIGSTVRGAGVPQAVRNLTKTFSYNDMDSLKKIFDEHPDNVAAVIMEPMTFVEPKAGFLESVKELVHRNQAILIFDEICTGWHFGLGGAQKHFGVTPDLACFGKAMGNGFPISAIVGKAEIMKIFEDIFVSFTFGGEAMSMAASLQVIRILEDEPVVETLRRNGNILKEKINDLSKLHGIEGHVQCVGMPQWSLIKFMNDRQEDSLELKSLFQQEVLKRGILFLGTHNMNFTLTDELVRQTVNVYGEVIPFIAEAIRSGEVDKRLEGTKIQAVFKVR
jgi:glutamate-1-semialdehyde 2,1-aminomutase/spore coat polysaccharide biosynthesis protein SpsF